MTPTSPEDQVPNTRELPPLMLPQSAGSVNPVSRLIMTKWFLIHTNAVAIE